MKSGNENAPKHPCRAKRLSWERTALVSLKPGSPVPAMVSWRWQSVVQNRFWVTHFGCGSKHMGSKSNPGKWKRGLDYHLLSPGSNLIHTQATNESYGAKNIRMVYCKLLRTRFFETVGMGPTRRPSRFQASPSQEGPVSRQPAPKKG